MSTHVRIPVARKPLTTVTRLVPRPTPQRVWDGTKWTSAYDQRRRLPWRMTAMLLLIVLALVGLVAVSVGIAVQMETRGADTSTSPACLPFIC